MIYKQIQIKVGLLLLLTPVLAVVFGQQPDPPGQVEQPADAVNQAYLFAHMTHQDYGKLYYSVSTDGLHWHALNGKRRVFEDYRGHPDICKGHDGRYYLAGNTSDSSPDIDIWVSTDLLWCPLYAVYARS